nr:immunoglobulin light chain junction region [Macaca mulatta]
CMQHTALPLTF